MSSSISTYDLANLGLENYEPNELVLNTVHDLTQFFNNKENCTCRIAKNQKDLRKCYEKVGFKRFFQRHFEIRGLQKTEREIFLKAQLMSFETTNEKNNENKLRINYRYNFNFTLPLCKTVYLKLNGITDYYLTTIQKHLQENGLTERVHGNTGHSPKLASRTFIDFEKSSILKQFLIQYGNTYGLPSPMRHKKDLDVFIYLPTEKSYKSVYQEYKDQYSIEYDQNEKVMSYDSFVKLWHELVPYIKFESIASDLCETCVNFKAELMLAKNNKEQFDIITNQYKEHRDIADLEREHYNNNIIESKNDLSVAHICYDWAQNVCIPYSPQQVGAIFFKNTFSVHIFGVCKTEEGQNKQLNFIIGEDEFPKGTTKGANTTLNLVYSALKNFAKEGKKHLKVTCDNCAGQNKNNLSLWFWAWLIMLKWYDDITINFMIPGHTKFICDSNFGHIKKKYWKTKINTMDDIERVIKSSAKLNEAVRYKNNPEWTWYDFDSFLRPHFKPLPNIKQYHHFRFSNENNDIGKVYVSKKSGETETSFILLNNNKFNFNEELNIIPISPLTNERKNYLYTKVRQHVDDPYKDIHFSKP